MTPNLSDSDTLDKPTPLSSFVCFQKIFILPHGRSLEIPWGGGRVLKAKLLEEKYEAKLEFPGG